MFSGFDGAGSPSFEFVESIDSHSSSRGGGAGKGLLPSVSVGNSLADKKSCCTIAVSAACKSQHKYKKPRKMRRFQGQRASYIFIILEFEKASHEKMQYLQTSTLEP